MSINTNYNYYNYSDVIFGGIGKQQINTTSNKNNNWWGTNNSSVSDSTKSYLTNIKDGAKTLTSALDNLYGRQKTVSAFNKKDVVSSDSTSVQIKTTSRADLDQFNEMKISVNQVASGQVNEGSSLEANRKFIVGGDYDFEIKNAQTGKIQKFSVSVRSGETNEDLQNKMMEAINKSDIGVSATVSYDAQLKTSTLTVQSKETGDSNANRFTISGNGAIYTGIHVKTQDAQDARYQIDGGTMISSASNEIKLADGVTATLRSKTADDVTISVGKDSTHAINQVREMVNGYNALLDAASSNSTDKGANRLLNELKNLQTYSASLEKIGVTFNSSGYMEINEKTMENAANNGKLEEFYNEDKGAGYGFNYRIQRVADSVYNDPTRYVSQQSLNRNDSVGDSGASFNDLFGNTNNYGWGSLFTPTQYNAYNNYMNMGLLFQSWF